jgi:hypothetical protein
LVDLVSRAREGILIYHRAMIPSNPAARRWSR